VVLGTATYMSPEQAKGKAADKRIDIWAFGCVLYECLTGKKTFWGDTIAETVAAILESEPDWQALPASLPWKVKDLLHRCLQKDPRERLHDIADARIEIHESTGKPNETVIAARPFSMRWLALGAALVLLAGILIGRVLPKHSETVLQSRVVRSVIKLEPGHILAGMIWECYYRLPTRTAVAISKDGSFIVYSAIAEDQGPQVKPQLYLRRTNQLEARGILGTKGGISPFLSPDDRWVGFWADAKLLKVPIDGGVPVTLCDSEMPFGASWGPDNTIVFAPDHDGGLSIVAAGGGDPELLTKPDKANEEYSHRQSREGVS
jgi:hypothetical protein